MEPLLKARDVSVKVLRKTRRGAVSGFAAPVAQAPARQPAPKTVSVPPNQTPLAKAPDTGEALAGGAAGRLALGYKPRFEHAPGGASADFTAGVSPKKSGAPDGKDHKWIGKSF